MLGFLLRSLWRLIILLAGALSLWTAFFIVMPYADERIPQFVVLFVLYCAFAYGIIPALIRVFRLVIKPNHIPLYASTGDGWPSDPVNIALIVRDKQHLQKVMEGAGWITADPMTLKNSFRALVSIIFNTPYPAAPFSNLYLFNRAHDIGFEMPNNDTKSARTRHHVRFWKLQEPTDSIAKNHHYTFWYEKLQKWLGVNREIWIGAAVEETSAIRIQWRTGQLTHGGHKDSDRERDFIISGLESKNLIHSLHTSTAGKELRFRGQQISAVYITDGSLKVVQLRRARRIKKK